MFLDVRISEDEVAAAGFLFDLNVADGRFFEVADRDPRIYPARGEVLPDPRADRVASHKIAIERHRSAQRLQAAGGVERAAPRGFTLKKKMTIRFALGKLIENPKMIPTHFAQAE